MATSLRVLILEDRPSDAKLIVHELRRAGYEPDWQRVDTEADYLARLEPAPDIVLADYALPQWDAPHALHALQERNLDIPFIMISGSVGEDIAVECMKQGAADYLLKDRLARLGQAVKKVLEDKRFRDEKRRAEQALRESEADYRSLLMHLQVGVIVRSSDSRIVMSNEAANAFFGLTADQMLGKTTANQPWRFLREDGTVMLPEEHPVTRVIATGQPLQGLVVGVDNPTVSHVRWALVTAYPQYSGQGELQQVVVIFVDITERKQAEAARAAEHNLLRAVIDNLPDYIFAKDSEGRFSLSNVAHAQATHGAQPEDLIGKTALELYPPHLAVQFHDDDVRILETGQALTNAERLTLGPDGQERTVLTTKVPLRDSKGAVIGLVGISRDITERKRTEQALHESELKFRRFVEESSEGIVLTDEQGTITEWNRSQEQITGLLRADVLGQPLWDIQYRMATDTRRPQIALAQLRAMLLEFLRTGSAPWASQAMENEIKRGDGTIRSAQVLVFPIPSDKGYIGASVLRDTTERKQIEAAERDQHLLAEALRDTAEALASLIDPDAVMARILENVGRVVPHDACNLMLIKGNTARVVYCRGWSPDEEAEFRTTPFSLELTNLGDMLRSRSSIFISDTETYPGWVSVSSWTRSFVGTPIQIHGNIIGFLSLHSRVPDFFTARHAERLGAFADQAAVALENAQLYDELRRRASELERRVDERTVELRRAKEHVEAILNSSSDGIILFNASHGIRQTNPAFDVLFGCPPDHCLNMRLTALVSPEDAPSLEEALLATTQDTINRLEVRARRSDGTFFDAEMGLAPVMEGQAASGTVVCILRDITERKRAVEALRASEERFRSFFDLPLIGMALTSVEKGTSLVNDKLCEMLQYSRDELLPLSWPELTHPDDLAADTAQFNRVLAGEIEGYSLDKRFMTKSRQAINVIMTCRCVRDEQGKVTHFAALVQDITERIRIETALRESEEQFRQIAENFDQILFLRSSDDQKMLYVNPRYETMWGMSRESLYENPGSYFERIHPDDVGDVRQQLASKRYVEEGFADYEFRVILPDHTIHWARARRFPVKADDGTIVRRVGLVEDITERKQAQDELREQHDFLNQVINNLPGLIMVKDRAGRFLLVNNEEARIHSSTLADMLGKTDADFNPNRVEVEFFWQKDREALNTGQPLFIPEETVFGRYYQTSKIPLKNRDGAYDRLLVVCSDITERRHAEQVLQEALAKEKELGELKTRFVSMASHEFRTPLATIQATADTLASYRHRMSQEQIEQKLTKIKEQVGHLKDIMDDVLLLARMQARRVEFDPILLDPNALCQTVIEEFQSRPDIQHQILYTFEGLEELAKLDKKLMREMINNFISNAIKYSPPDKPVTVHLERTPDALVLRVVDQGIGIPDADQNHLFEPFHRATNVGSVSGTGLGLVITKEAVDMHGGTITVESQVGTGTTFTVHIPITL